MTGGRAAFVPAWLSLRFVPDHAGTPAGQLTVFGYRSCNLRTSAIAGSSGSLTPKDELKLWIVLLAVTAKCLPRFADRFLSAVSGSIREEVNAEGSHFSHALRRRWVQEASDTASGKQVEAKAG